MAEDLAGDPTENIDIGKTVTKGEAGEDIQIGVDPVKEILIFPSQNNRTYRAGYVQLMAFANPYNLKDISGSVDKELGYRQTHTKVEKRAPTFNGSHSKYLANARANNRRFRKIPGTKMVFNCILPMPLGVAETTSIEWQSAPSGFNKSIVGGAYNAESNWMQYVRSGGQFTEGIQGGIDLIKQGAASTVDKLAEMVPGMDIAGSVKSLKNGAGMLVDAGTLGTQVVAGAVLGDNSMHTAAMNSVAGSIVTRPSKKMMQLQGPIMDYVREASALNGRRQIVMDPGYWQSFQGVSPRGFTLRWSIIPENHEDAMAGLALCARLKEFSLPESVSTVELLTPHYWQIQFSNPLVQSQLLYNNLVIKNIDINFMESGEVHLSGTPKKFDIAIQFEEVKSPTADVFKVYNEALVVGGGKLRNAPSKALASVGKVSPGQGPFGGKLGSTFGGKFGGLGSGALGKLGAVRGAVLGKVAGLVGKQLGGLANALGDAAGGLVGGYLGDFAGNLVSDTVSGAANSASATLTGAIASGDFNDLGSKLRDSALAGAAGGAVGAVTEVVDEYATKATNYAMDKLNNTIGDVVDWGNEKLGNITPEEKEARSKARESAQKAKDSAKELAELKKDYEKIENSGLSPAEKAKAKAQVDKKFDEASKQAEEAKKYKAQAEKFEKDREAKEAAEKIRAEQAKREKEAKEAAKRLGITDPDER